MAFDFNQWIDRRHSDSLKWHKYGDRDVLPLWVADSDFRSPPSVIEAIKQRAEHGVFGYGATPSGLIDITLSRLAQRYNWQIEPDWIVLLPGVVCGLNLSVRAFTESGESTVSPTPIYPPFRGAAKLADRAQVHLPLRLQDDRWVMDLDSSAMQGNERLLMLCNPQNPGGTVYRRDELEAQLAFAQQHDLIVCSDEIHCDLLLSPGAQHIPFAALSEDAAQRSITLISPSKTFNIAGLGASMAIIPNPELRARFKRVREGIVPGVDILALVAAEAAWRDGDEWLAAQLDYLRANRDWLVAQVNALPELQMAAPEATYLGWIDASKLDVASPMDYFEQHGLGFSPGHDFGDDNFVRFNFGCTRATLEQAVTRLQLAVAARR
ncbi:cystathione beta-lyase [Candidatus Pantoea symbiotica]|jgi:cystathionine beta-lyase|uniref:cysteine-S-conjugate beta-lyase n=1 Tax=Candidatus Pantoea symbiotica TaxID=1884370 RepID=A0A1I3TDC6_9GAMM|nr:MULTISPECIES: PatB family C-S lyase [Pantoea]KAJ9432833.1 PatB family C-S lyase [Pantoea sp. YR343]MRT23633.1 putative C-S lyase [Enterobacteriaceae bacterium RIT697]SFJ67666.1 cystathione beta-lyase [Pantoea symbiotica]SFU50882.1 cystathione beta-lyase [Pantoea sp. YR525]